VETAFTKAVAKADLQGLCTGTVSDLEAVIDDYIAALDAQIATPTTTTTATPATTTTSTTAPLGPEQCCEFDPTSTVAVCRWETPSDCIALGGTPGAAGSACDAATGSCGATVGDGNCCSVVNNDPYCYSGPGVTASTCTSAGGTLSTGICGAPGTACTP
jgi:hypothetical protein